MADDLFKSMQISASGMKVQGSRLRVISQNLANADSLPQDPSQSPYRRKVITFKNVLDRGSGLELVEVDKVGLDKSDFEKRYEPGHPAAGSDGFVEAPNINSLVEMMDMRQAQRSYEANLNVIKTSRSMLQSAIDVLR